MDYHEKYPNILCGIDVDTQTTWLAINKSTGDVAFLTNYRCIGNSNKTEKFSSRGNLIFEYVKAGDTSITDKLYHSIDEFEQNIFKGKKYKGFNLVIGNVLNGTLKYLQNKNLDPLADNQLSIEQAEVIKQDEIQGLSNGDLNKWHKVHYGRVKTSTVLRKTAKWEVKEDRAVEHMCEVADAITE